MRLFPSTERTRAEKLSRLDRFAGMTAADVRTVVKAATTVRLEPGEVLTSEGERADGAYVVLSGQLTVTRADESIRELGPGDLVGEIGVVARPLRTATVTAATECVALHVPAEATARLLDDVPAFRAALEQTAAKRLTRDLHTE